MKVIKFDPKNKPDFVREDWLLDDREKGIQIKGYWIIKGKNEEEVLLEAGDFILVDLGVYDVVKMEAYESDREIRQKVNELIGKSLASQLISEITENYSGQEQADLMDKFNSVILCLNAGILPGAKESNLRINTDDKYSSALQILVDNKITSVITDDIISATKIV